MPWKHIVSPTKGLITNQASTTIDDRASPYMSGITLRNGEVRSDFGMVDFPTAGATASNALNGTVMNIGQFYLLNGVSYLIAITTTQIYYYNTTTGTWDCITRGTEIDDCEAAWDQETGVVCTADTVKLRGTYSSKNIILTAVPAIHFPLDDDAADTDVEDTGGDLTGTASQNTEDVTASGVIGDCFNFESTGDEDCIDNDNAGLQAGILDDEVGSIAVWIRPESMAADMVICSWGDTNGNGRLVLKILTTGEVSAELHNGTATQWQVTTAAGCVEAGTWYHIVLRQTGTAIEIHLDTENEDLISVVATDLTMWLADITGIDNARIACHNYNSGGDAEFFDGLMDDWRYYSSSIPLRDIDGLHNAGNGTGEVGGFTTGIISSEGNLSNTNMTDATSTHLTYWIRADKAIAAEVLSVRLSEQASGAAGATYADYYVPALIANEWQHVSVDITAPDADDGGDYPDDLNVLASVALIANSDTSGATIYIDDIRATKAFTGDEDNRFSTTVLNDAMVLTNGIDPPSQVTTGPAHNHVTLTLPAGAITTCEVVVTFKDHLLYMNNTENGGDAPQRVSWTNIGSIQDHVAGTAGFQDLIDDDSWIVGAALLSENELIIYKERSVILCTWVGGHTPFRFRTVAHDIGLMNKDCVAQTGGGHIALGLKFTYIYKIGGGIQAIDDNIKQYMYDRLDGAYITRAFIFFTQEDDELQIWIPVSDTIADEGYCLNVRDNAWYIKDRQINCAGTYQSQSTLTIGDLTGTIGEQNWTFGSQLIKQYATITLVGDDNGKVFKLDRASLNNDGVAITNHFETPDFVVPDSKQYMNDNMRVAQLIYEAKGQSVTTQYSTDGGSTWNDTEGAGNHVQTLTSVYTSYEQFFETDAKRIRYRFLNSTVSSGYHIRHYAFYWLQRTGRK